MKGDPKQSNKEKNSQHNKMSENHFSMSPTQQNRVSLFSMTAKVPEKKSPQNISKGNESNREEKEKKIQQLQRDIVQKKEKNDSVQEAFLKKK